MKKSMETIYPGSVAVYNIANVIARNAALSGLPDKTAVIDASREGDGKYSYAQLNSRVNKLAHTLLKSVSRGETGFLSCFQTRSRPWRPSLPA